MEEDNQSELAILKLANILFWINLAPAFVASIVLIAALLNIISNHTLSSLVAIILLITGIICEWIYFKQRSSLEFAIKKIGWIYSIIVSIIFLTPQVAYLFSKENGTFILILMIYPMSFIVASLYALIKITKLNKQVKGN